MGSLANMAIQVVFACALHGDIVVIYQLNAHAYENTVQFRLESEEEKSGVVAGRRCPLDWSASLKNIIARTRQDAAESKRHCSAVGCLWEVL